MTPDTGLTRRNFLKLSGAVLAAAAFAKPPEGRQGYEISPNVYQLKWGKVVLPGYQVLPGDNIGFLARAFATKYDLIVEANNLVGPIQPGEVLKIPSGAAFPLSYLPEPGIIRHQLTQGEKPQDIASRYRVPLGAVLKSITERDVFVTPQETVLAIRGVDSPSLIPLNIDFNQPDPISGEVLKAVVDRVVSSYLYEVRGDTAVFRLLKARGINVTFGITGSNFPNFLSLSASALTTEADLRRQIGHELGHLLAFPWWSTGADEGTAGFVASEWATRNHTEYAPSVSALKLWESDKYYDRVNAPTLRQTVFSERPVENRILATQAWQRIEKRFPGTVAYLLVKASHHEAVDKIGPGQWPLDLIMGWVAEKSGQTAVDFINSQHILFTK